MMLDYKLDWYPDPHGEGWNVPYCCEIGSVSFSSDYQYWNAYRVDGKKFRVLADGRGGQLGAEDWYFSVYIKNVIASRLNEDSNTGDYNETDTDQFRDMVRIGFEREIESYGIADGMYRRAIDPAYVHEPAYLMGHRKGMAFDAMPDEAE